MAARLRPLLLAVLLAPALAAPTFAQGGDAAPDVGLGSPAATLRTFLDAMNRDPVDDEVALSALNTSQVARDAAPELALRLWRILNRIEMVQVERDPTIPGAADLEGTIAGETGAWTFFPRPLQLRDGETPFSFALRSQRHRQVAELAPDLRIVLRRDGEGRWRFSAETVAGAEAAWERLRGIEPVGALTGIDERRTASERIESSLPSWTRERGFLGVEVWQWIGLALLIVLGLVVDLVVRVITATAARIAIRRRGGDVDGGSVKRMVRPFGMAIGAMAWLLLLPLLGLPSAALVVVGPALRLYAMLSVVWSGFRLIDVVGEFFHSKAAATETKFDDLVVPLVRKSLKVLVGIFGLIYIASSFEIEIAPLLTGLGIGGVGFAFAAKDTLENFFGSITVILDRPFQVGDWVTIGDVEGTVEELGLRSVRVRTFYNSLVTIPTANLVRAAVDNYGRRKYRRWTTHLTILYETPPETVEAFCEGIRQLIREHPYTRKDYYQVWLHKFGPSSLDVLVYMFFEAPEWTTELRERHRLMLDIMRLARTLGVEFAYPTNTTYLVRGEQYDAERAAELQQPPAAAELRARRTGRDAARDVTAEARWRSKRPQPYHFTGAGDPIDEDHPEAPPESQVESRVGGDAG